jgi:predicted transcriptional regulator of viral defense system
MFVEYLEKLRASGRRYFTSEELIKDLGISDIAARSGLYRLKKNAKLISPLSGLYVIVPPEHQPYGSIPAEELLPIMMKHLKAEYYVALLSAANYFGAAHQKSARFQVISNKRIKHSLEFGRVAIELIYKNSLMNLPIQNFTVKTGYLQVATPDLIAIDLFKYAKRAAGISHIATVLSELIESIDENNLIKLAESTNELCQLQRLGYVIEKIDVMDEDKKQRIVNNLTEYLRHSDRPFVSLVPYIPIKGYPKCEKWKIIENTDFESDL